MPSLQQLCCTFRRANTPAGLGRGFRRRHTVRATVAGRTSCPTSPKITENHRKSRPRGRKIECGRAWAVVARSWVHIRQAGTKREGKDAKLARNGPDPGPGAVAGRRRPGRRRQPPDGLRPAGGFWPPRAALGARGAARGFAERDYALRVQRAARYRKRPTESPATPPTTPPYKIFVRGSGVAADATGPHAGEPRRHIGGPRARTWGTPATPLGVPCAQGRPAARETRGVRIRPREVRRRAPERAPGTSAAGPAGPCLGGFWRFGRQT